MREGRASAHDKLKKGLETNVITDDNPGFKMMKMMGYKMGNGLGKQGTFKNVSNNDDNNKVPKNVPSLSVAFRWVSSLSIAFLALPLRFEPFQAILSSSSVQILFFTFRAFPLYSVAFPLRSIAS